jgi:ATP/maltotriose-dependent transcriptional regulator MalT
MLASASGSEQPQERSAGLYVLAFAHAYLGAIDEARSSAQEGVALSREAHDEIFWVQNEAALGFIELSLGDDAAADRHLRPLWPMLAALGYGEPSVYPVFPNAVEALIGLAEFDEAERLLSELEACGARLESPWALSQAARCRGALTAARGEGAGALPHFEQALAQLDRSRLPFERGRTELAQGVALRRVKRKRDARASLQRAMTTFGEIGAPLWEQRARLELSRIGGRAAAAGALTPSEQRLADVVATGRSNKQAAADLYITVNTVEKSLSRIYAKLGVRSRTELAARLQDLSAEQEGDPPPATRSSS